MFYVGGWPPTVDAAPQLDGVHSTAYMLLFIFAVFERFPCDRDLRCGGEPMRFGVLGSWVMEDIAITIPTARFSVFGGFAVMTSLLWRCES